MNDQAQQISRTDANRPQGSTWDGTQNEHPAESAGLNPLTMGLDVEPEPAYNASLLDILRLMIFAVLLRLAEAVAIEDDTPGWWRQEPAESWRQAVDTDALERREAL